MYTVLIADDNRQTTNGLAKMIRWQDIGCECAGLAYNGKQAADLIASAKPNAVITDIEMPMMDGIQLAKLISENYPGIRVIMISAYDKFEYAKAALEYNVQDYILKPLTREKIGEIEKKLVAFRDAEQTNLQIWKNRLDSANSSELAKHIGAGDPKELYDYLLGVFPAASRNLNGPQEFADIKEVTKSNILRVFTECESLNKSADRNRTDFQKYLNMVISAADMQDIRDLYRILAEDVCELVNTSKNKDTYSLIDEICVFILKNINNTELNIPLICQKFNISTSYLSALFRKHGKGSVNSYIIMVRHDYAKELLSSTRLNINEIAAKCGYYDAHYFSRAFKKMQGVTPKEYRALYFSDES